MGDRTCTVAGCAKPHRARGLCATHHQRWRHYGDPLATQRPLWFKPSEEQFFAKVDAEGDCWQWVGCIRKDGYGQFRHAKAHQWSWRHLVGDVPAGMQLDHLCRNRGCVNPDHLEPVTPQLNILRGIGPTAVNARKTHCPQGHPYAGDNLRVYTRPNGVTSRYCRTCRSDDSKRRRAQDASRMATV